MTAAGRAITLRLDEADAAQLDLIAAVKGTTVTEQLRTAVRAHIARHRADRVFRAAAEAHLDRQRKFLLEGDGP